MLISLPFLSSSPEDNDNDAARYSFTGSYPMNSFGEWHNGVHLIAPATAIGASPVRAIADGKVIHVITPDAQASKDPAHPQNYGAFTDGLEWSDKGMVILEHSTEIGHDGTAAVSLSFYSVYMHLKALAQVKVKDAKGQSTERPLQVGDTVWRKAELGRAGHIYGQHDHLHFEVCMDEANLTKLLGHAPTEHPRTDALPRRDGRSDAVFGSTCVFLPVGTPLLAAEPTTHLRTSSTEMLKTALWVNIDYAGSAVLTSHYADGDNAGRPIAGEANLSTSQFTETDGEYKLYEAANKRHNSLSPADQAQSSPSGWYELLRFGRRLGTDPLPPGAEHWRKIKTPSGERWANLNAAGTCKYSDADFPSFKGWQCIGDDPTGEDQRCDSPTLRSLLLRRFVEPAQREEAMAKTAQGRKLLATKAAPPAGDTFRNKLERLICKFPSEFDRATIDARYAHVKDEPYFKDNPKNWELLRQHIDAVCRTKPKTQKPNPSSVDPAGSG